eukprot:5648135-Pyramimonas_sp.AAC.1
MNRRKRSSNIQEEHARIPEATIAGPFNHPRLQFSDIVQGIAASNGPPLTRHYGMLGLCLERDREGSRDHLVARVAKCERAGLLGFQDRFSLTVSDVNLR